MGVLTFHRCINYGSYWQARCLVQGLRRRGHDAVLLDHHSDRVQRAELHCALQPGLPVRTARAALGEYKRKVRKFYTAFEGLPTSQPFPLEQPDLADRYDALVVGSDEVWNFCHPWYGNEPIFFGEGLQADRLIAYAASFGNHDAKRGVPHHRAEQLLQFTALSVRDGNSHRLVEQATGKDVELVLDPCLQFADLIDVPAALTAEPFAIVYGHGFPVWLQRAVRRWSRRRGLPLISVGYANDWVDEQRIALGPEEFASAFRGAAAVVTNFFHGCVFSLVNDKPFVAVRTDYRSTKLIELTQQVEISDRLIGEDVEQEELEALLDDPPLAETRWRLEHYRHRSDTYLDAALG